MVLIKEKSLNLKFKPHNIYNPNQTRKDFIQTSKIHSELLFKHCSCYSDTRGVTMGWMVDMTISCVLLWRSALSGKMAGTTTIEVDVGGGSNSQWHR
jgi:hypothetical protein